MSYISKWTGRHTVSHRKLIRNMEQVQKCNNVPTATGLFNFKVYTLASLMMNKVMNSRALCFTIVIVL